MWRISVVIPNQHVNTANIDPRPDHALQPIQPVLLPLTSAPGHALLPGAACRQVRMQTAMAPCRCANIIAPDHAGWQGHCGTDTTRPRPGHRTATARAKLGNIDVSPSLKFWKSNPSPIWTLFAQTKFPWIIFMHAILQNSRISLWYKGAQDNFAFCAERHHLVQDGSLRATSVYPRTTWHHSILHSIAPQRSEQAERALVQQKRTK